jgi:hypothetical protein
MSELASQLGRLWTVIDDLNRDVPNEVAAVPDTQSTLILLGLLRNARKELQVVEQFVERAAAESMFDDRFEGPGVLAVRRQTAEQTVWQHEDLATAVLTAAVVDENGELPSEDANVLACKVKQALMACAAVSYWRVGKLEEHGISVNDYRTRTPGRWTVDVTLGEGVEAA